MQKTKVVTIVASVAYFCLLTWVIIFKCNLLTSDLRFGYRSINLVPFDKIANVGHFFDYLLNVVVYVPTGFYVCAFLKDKPIAHKIFVIALSSILFEVVQYAIALGSTDISDVISNTLGGVVGLWLYCKTKNCRFFNIFNLCMIFVGIPLVIFAVVHTASVFSIYLS
ncbi:MAG: VanZ family protein [Clostridia bacterium]|nr:VanZ family protein [Clostridia bacterium]